MNAINWFEIPAADFDRAVTFYETILGKPIRREVFAGLPNGILPYEQDSGVGGSIVHGDGNTPAMNGPLVYLNTGMELAAVVGRVESAGGQVLLPLTPIGPAGTIALIRDSEGNRVGLHQPLEN